MPQSMRFTGWTVTNTDGWLYRIMVTLHESLAPLTLHQIRIRCGMQTAVDHQIIDALVDRFVAQGWIQVHWGDGPFVPTYSIDKARIHREHVTDTDKEAL